MVRIFRSYATSAMVREGGCSGACVGGGGTWIWSCCAG
jgi:hypothetical protein